MILESALLAFAAAGKPRTRGDDPTIIIRMEKETM